MKLEAFAIGTTTKNLSGTYTSIPVSVRCPLSVGIEYLIVDKNTGDFFAITVNQKPPNVSGGEVQISIDEQSITATKGALIIRDPAQVEAELSHFWEYIKGKENEKLP